MKIGFEVKKYRSSLRPPLLPEYFSPVSMRIREISKDFGPILLIFRVLFCFYVSKAFLNVPGWRNVTCFVCVHPLNPNRQRGSC
jgi:hypothetical protein